ncbi:hypothetical protein [Nostoc sp.]|uniref:hypothetical protein n=1 Tax=Nostoc sp. TaxID=1180 RepID=UPI002FF63E87
MKRSPKLIAKNQDSDRTITIKRSVSLLTSFSVCWYTIFRWRSKLHVADSPEGMAFSTINVFT